MDKFQQIRTYLAVAEQGSFVAAADTLGLSPQLVSKYVAALEADLGSRLLNRTTRRVNMTEAGAQYFAEASELIEALERLAPVDVDVCPPSAHQRSTNIALPDDDIPRRSLIRIDLGVVPRGVPRSHPEGARAQGLDQCSYLTYAGLCCGRYPMAMGERGCREVPGGPSRAPNRAPTPPKAKARG